MIILFFFLPSNFFCHLAFLIVFELLTSFHNLYNLLCCLIFMLRFCSCFCFVPSTKRNTENAPKCVRKGTKKTPKGPSAVAAATHGGPKWPPETPQSPSKMQMEPPSASLAGPRVAREAPESTPNRPENDQNHRFSFSFWWVSQEYVFWMQRRPKQKERKRRESAKTCFREAEQRESRKYALLEIFCFAKSSKLLREY